MLRHRELTDITVGFIGIAAILLFAWRRRNRRNKAAHRQSDRWLMDPSNPPTPSSSAAPSFTRKSRFWESTVFKIPHVRKRFGADGWETISDSNVDPFEDKTAYRASKHSLVSQPAMTEVVPPVPVLSRANTTKSSKSVAATGAPGVKSKASAASLPNLNLTLPSTTAGIQAYRISDLSSLSSGFGDGEIVVPRAVAKARASTGSSGSRGSTNGTRTPRSPRSPRRDTVYTEASEDTPTRFRTVNSWVRVQTSRIKRANWREQDTGSDSNGGAPPVPQLPPEQDFGMMMPDGEEPRRVSDTQLTVEYGTAH